MGAYTASQEVQNALAALNTIQNSQPGSYQQSQAVINALAALNAIRQGQPGAYQQSEEVQNAYNALMNLINGQLQDIPGVSATETLISLEQSIKRDIPVHFEENETE